MTSDKRPLTANRLGLRIRQAYLASYPNRMQFSKDARLSYAALCNWENGTVAPSTRSLDKIAKHTGYSRTELLGESGTDHTHSPYPAYSKFLRTPEGKACGVDHRRQLAGLQFDSEPTVLDFAIVFKVLTS